MEECFYRGTAKVLLNVKLWLLPKCFVDKRRVTVLAGVIAHDLQDMVWLLGRAMRAGRNVLGIQVVHLSIPWYSLAQFL